VGILSKNTCYSIYPYSCEGTYSFIGNGVGKGKQITYAEAWKGIKKMVK
jgi:hypothetical protein